MPCRQRISTIPQRPGGASPEPAAAGGAIAQPLAQTSQHQSAVIDTLQQLLDQFARWEGFRRLVRDVDALRDEQQQLARRTDRLQQSTLAKNWEALSAGEQSELTQASLDQWQLAQRLDELLRQMGEVRDQLAASDRPASEAIDHALQAANRLPLSSLMRRAAAALRGIT